jgi:hypothetical protein
MKIKDIADDRHQNDGQYDDYRFGHFHGLSLPLSAFLKSSSPANVVRFY